MKIGLFFCFIAVFAKTQGQIKAEGQNFDKKGYYAVLATGTLTAVDSELLVLDHKMPEGMSGTTSNAGSNEKQAFTGALLMKKAGLLHKPKEKLSAFRSGATKLETALAADSANTEYHFLRLIIQEHAPAIVHYNKNIAEDCQKIYRNFKSLSPVVQKAIVDYTEHSKQLHANQLNG